MKPEKAFNLDLMQLTKERLQGVGQVKVVDIFDGISNNFHEEGLFSPSLFGEVGTEARDVTFGYIKLNTTIFNPVIYERLKKLKRLYDGIMMGTAYAVFDEKEKDFVSSTPLEGETGYSFFMLHWDKIKLKKNESARRNIMIDIVEKNKDRLFLEYHLVLPAGLRDYYVDKNGEATQDEINDLYRKMIAISNSLSDLTPTQAAQQDMARRNLQRCANDIYEYIKTLMTGKKGFLQAKWGGRNIYNGTRNVITSMDTSAEVLGDERAPDIHTTFVSLFQLMKGCLPLAVHLIKSHPYYRLAFRGDNEFVYVINQESLKREQIKLDQWVADNWQSNEGLERLIDKFGNDDFRHQRIDISRHWFGLIYQDEEKYQLLEDIDDLPEGWDKKYVRPLRYVDFLYLVGKDKWYELRATTTRYPVAGKGSIYPVKTYVKTTTTAKSLKEYQQGQWVEGSIAREFPYIPEGTRPTYHNTQSPHPGRLAGAAADFDGDQQSLVVLYSDEALDEINQYFGKRESIIGLKGSFTIDYNTDIVKRALQSIGQKPTHRRTA